MATNKINIFYKEPDPDRWFKYDRYPRKVIRRVIRGKRRPGGQEMVYLNLKLGLDKLGIAYRDNDYSYIKRNQNDLACIIGKPQVLFDREWKNPILFGAAVFSHPIDYPDLFQKYNIKKILVPGVWMQKMFEPYYGNNVISWPVGIDTNFWKPVEKNKNFKILIYDKIMWDHIEYENNLINPILSYLKSNSIEFKVIRYGFYRPAELLEIVKEVNAAIFLCEHETQGLAYQQILSAGVPIFALDMAGYWKDPAYFPHKIKFQPVTSVPYWDDRCGTKFKDFNEFESGFFEFWDNVKTNKFNPRSYILENLTLEKCAQKYVDIINSINS